MTINQAPLEQKLKELICGTVYFKPNPGNAGDALIAYATFQMLERLGVKYRVIRDVTEIDFSDEIFIYGGGGNFIDLYHGDARETIDYLHNKVKKLIILPSTITGNEDILQILGSNVEIFCREQTTFDYVSGIVTDANVYLAHDMAFYIDLDLLFSEQMPNQLLNVIQKIIYKITMDQRQYELPSPKRIASSQISLFRWMKHIDNNAKTVNCFRTDRESNAEFLSYQNIDISKVFDFGAQSRGLTVYSSRRLMNFIERYDVIRTNRLHVAIACAILNKNVHFYPNSYYKCQAVFEHSMKTKFRNVSWKG